MAHISGLVATQVADNPFEYCDIVTTTTHKSLRGPRAGMIFFRKDDRDFKTKINNAVFPALQGGPHIHQIAGIATQLKEVMSQEFKDYANQVVKNSRALAASLSKKGYTLCSGGTDNHLILWNLRPQGLTGSKLEKVCDKLGITLNKNCVPEDLSAVSPGGVRVGTSYYQRKRERYKARSDRHVFISFIFFFFLLVSLPSHNAKPCSQVHPR